MRVVEHATGTSTAVAQPESPSTVWGEANPEYDSTVLRYGYTSLATPRSTYDLDLDKAVAPHTNGPLRHDPSLIRARRCERDRAQPAAAPGGGSRRLPPWGC